MLNRGKQAGEAALQKPLRLWPGVVIVALQWLVRYVVPMFIPDAMIYGVFGGIFGGLLIVVWWAFFSRAPRLERWGAVILMIIALIATSYIIDESIATAGQGMFFAIYAIPVMSLALVVWSLAGRRLSDKPRRATLIATILLACGGWTLLRIDGVTGNFSAEFAWRWAQTAEERLLAQMVDEPMVLLPAPVLKDTEADWPGFRGPERNSIIRGVRIKTDWSASPPVELWRRPVGPGVSSFAVRGGLLYTQEQRGDDEVVSCYKVTTGEPVWRHSDNVRFWDSHAGAGPRSTPTLSDSCVYTFGATGILNVLDARDGMVVWSRNVASDTDAKDSGWGFTSSPLVVDSVVVVAATGKLAAYDLATGDPRWYGPDGGDSYSSPHLLTIAGVRQILLMSGTGVISVTPADGKLLWEHPWLRETRIVQPSLTEEGDILISAGEKKGMRRIAVGLGSEGWKIEERWTSSRLRPDFNDFVVHKGHAFGFDGRSIACIAVEDGKRKWKGGNYGSGQLLLLADQDLLLVLSEIGELALVKAVPDQFTELTRFPVIEGKTWNHPVLAGDIMLVRNMQEMAAFRLTLAGN
jgi:outer membrane protein assembly factor BamB